MKNNPFETSASKAEREANNVETLTKADLTNSLESLKDPYAKYLESVEKANRLGFGFSTREITNQIQKITDELSELPGDATEEKLSSLKKKLDSLKNDIRAGETVARIEARLP